MLKIRLQGTKNDIRWFLKILDREKKLEVANTSTFFSNKGTNKYKRVYSEIYRKGHGKSAQKESNQKAALDQASNERRIEYFGSGAKFL